MSLPTPPSGILDKDQPWYRGRISDAQWDRLKAKLTGGTDAGGTTYSKLIDCSAAEADKIIENLKKDPRGYPQMNTPGGGESYQIMIDFYQWLKDNYLTEEPKTEPENIPVEVEVVEVEQKTVDEPIVVKIEAPFEPAPEQKRQAPKRIRLPRRSGLIRARPIGPPRAEKKSAAERMADAFDERLDGLLDSIKNPPPPEQPKFRKIKDSLVKKPRKNVKVKASFDTEKTGRPFDNLAKFGFTKIKNSFKRAAEARRIAKESGADEKDRFHYLTKSLGFEFGGDRINRLKGTFSKKPAAFNDPALDRNQRFLAGIQGDLTPAPIKQGELFNTRKYEYTGIAKVVNDGLDRLKTSFTRVETNFNTVVKQKFSRADNSTAFEGIQSTIAELKRTLGEGNKLQKDINTVKDEQLSLQLEELDNKQLRQEEKEIEQGKNISGFLGLGKGKKKKDGEDEGGGEDPEGGGNWWDGLLGIGGGLLEFGLDWAVEEGVERGAKRLINWGGQQAAQKGGMAVGTAAAIVSGVGLAASGLGEGLFALGGKKGSLADMAIDAQLDGAKKLRANGNEWGANLLEFNAKKDMVSRESLKIIGNALDAIGTPFRYAIEAIRYPFINEEDREKQAYNLAKFDGRLREYSRGWMNRIDVLNIVPDEKGSFGNIYGNETANTEMMANMHSGGVIKMSEGGAMPQMPRLETKKGARLTGDIGTQQQTPAMFGEAGKELLIRNGDNPLQSMAPMIVAIREVTKRAGTFADPIEALARKVTDPIAKMLNLPIVSTPMKLKPAQKQKSGGGLWDKLGGFFGGGGSSEDEVESFEEEPEQGNAISVSGGAKGVLDLIASVESNGSYDIFNTSRGGTPGKATEKTIAWLGANAQGAIGRYQHMPEFIVDRAKRYGFSPNTLFTPDVQDALTIKMLEDSHGLNDFLSGKMSAEVFAAKLAPTWRGLPQGPAAAARLGGTADSTYNDQYASGNAAHIKWADTVATLKTVQAGGGTTASSSPSTVPASRGTVRAVGDSLAQGIADHSSAVDNATQGHSPAAVLATLKSTVTRANTGHVVLSTGLSNNMSDYANVERQMQYLQSKGIAFTVIPVNDAHSRKYGGGHNARLSSLARQYGGGFAGQLQGFSSNDNLHPSSYPDMIRKLNLR